MPIDLIDKWYDCGCHHYTTPSTVSGFAFPLHHWEFCWSHENDPVFRDHRGY